MLSLDKNKVLGRRSPLRISIRGSEKTETRHSGQRNMIKILHRRVEVKEERDGEGVLCCAASLESFSLSTDV